MEVVSNKIRHIQTVLIGKNIFPNDKRKHDHSGKHAEQQRDRTISLFLFAGKRDCGSRLSALLLRIRTRCRTRLRLRRHLAAVLVGTDLLSRDILCRLSVNKIGIIKFHIGVALVFVDIDEHFRGGLIAVVRILLHGAHNDLLESDRNIRIDLTRTHRILLQVHQRNGNRVFRLERKLARQHLIQYDADGIQVGF